MFFLFTVGCPCLLRSLISGSSFLLVFTIPYTKTTFFIFSLFDRFYARVGNKLIGLIIVCMVVHIRSNNLIKIFDSSLSNFLPCSFNKWLHELCLSAILGAQNQSIKSFSRWRYSLYVSWSRKYRNYSVFHLSTVSNVYYVSESLFGVLIKRFKPQTNPILHWNPYLFSIVLVTTWRWLHQGLQTNLPRGSKRTRHKDSLDTGLIENTPMAVQFKQGS